MRIKKFINCTATTNGQFYKLKGTMGTERDDDASLILAIARKRDRAAFSELFNRHKSYAYNLARRILRNSELAEDALQDAMLTVWQSAGNFRPEGDARGWILRIVTNKSLALIRKQTRRIKREERTVMEQPREQFAEVDGVENKETMALLRDQINQLPELESQLLACRFGAGLSHQKISESFNLSRSRVTEKLQTTMERLRINLAKAGIAATTPLLSPVSLLEAITSGDSLPPGITERIMERIDLAGSQTLHSSSSSSSSSSAASSAAKMASISVKTTPSLLTGMVFIAVTSGVLFLGLMNSDEIEPRNISLEGPENETSDVHTPLNKRWNFGNGPINELTTKFGSWKWDATHGEMICDKQTMVILPIEIERYPVVVELNVRLVKKSGVLQSTVTWIENMTLTPMKLWYRPSNPKQNKLRVQIYFLGQHKVTYLQDRIQSVGSLQGKTIPKQLVLVLENCAIREIKIRELTPKEIPAALHDPMNVISQDDFKSLTSPKIKIPSPTN